jgi:hypothetical protein
MSVWAYELGERLLTVPRRRTVTVGAGFGLLMLSGLALQRMAAHPWPLAGANPRLAVLASAFLAVALALRAAGWSRLFSRSERPWPREATATVSVASLASFLLPAKLDYGVKVWLANRLSRGRVAVEAAVVSLLLLGLIDAGTLIAPATLTAANTSSPALRVPLLLVALVGLACLGAVACSGRLVRLPFLRRSERALRFAQRLDQAVTRMRDNTLAYLLLTLSLWARAGGLLLLLAALGISFSLLTALVYICLTAGSAFLPLPSLGLGAGTAALSGLGIGLAKAADFALASALLTITAALTLAAASATIHLAQRHRRQQPAP